MTRGEVKVMIAKCDELLKLPTLPNNVYVEAGNKVINPFAFVSGHRGNLLGVTKGSIAKPYMVRLQRYIEIIEEKKDTAE